MEDGCENYTFTICTHFETGGALNTKRVELLEYFVDEKVHSLYGRVFQYSANYPPPRLHPGGYTHFPCNCCYCDTQHVSLPSMAMNCNYIEKLLFFATINIGPKNASPQKENAIYQPVQGHSPESWIKCFMKVFWFQGHLSLQRGQTKLVLHINKAKNICILKESKQ